MAKPFGCGADRAGDLSRGARGPEALSIANSPEYNNHFSFHLMLARDGDGGSIYRAGAAR